MLMWFILFHFPPDFLRPCIFHLAQFYKHTLSSFSEIAKHYVTLPASAMHFLKPVSRWCISFVQSSFLQQASLTITECEVSYVRIAPPPPKGHSDVCNSVYVRGSY